MTLQSAFDDFVFTTLAAIPGLLGKLEYIAGLREPNGNYMHWGLTRIYGELAAQEAAAHAHRLVFSRVLKTPVAKLLEDAVISSSGLKVRPEPYLDSLFRRVQELTPEKPGRASLLHFNSVLHAVSILAKRRQLATRPTS
jgi:hypothetical protein